MRLIPRLAQLCLAPLFLLSAARADFGISTDKKQHLLDSGAGLIVSIDKDNGGIRAITWLGTQINNPHRTSGLNSGLGEDGTEVKARQEGDAIIVTIQTDGSNQVVAHLTHTYVMRKGDNTLYITTHAMQEPGNGELRFIARLKGELFPSRPPESNLAGCTRTVESKDVFGKEDGTTFSKYYGNDQAKDLSLRGVTGPGRGVFMFYGNRESSAGGPFYRDIQNQSGTNAEVYNYMNSGHHQPEQLRQGVLHGPYALCFTDGGQPKEPSTSFLSELGIKGYVSKKGRGRIILNGLKGRDRDHSYIIGFANETAQYWARCKGLTGSASCYDMKPGTYTMTVYKGELALHTESVEVKANQPTTLHTITLNQDPSAQPSLWRIGDWDGTPLEFRNGAHISLMHPSDSRQAPWRVGTFTVGKDKTADFPACLWSDVNAGQVIQFQLTPEQLGKRTLRIGVTCNFSGARPQIRVNDWNSRLPAAPRKIDSRNLTIGSYRGINSTYTFTLHDKVLHAGENTLTLYATSGNGGSSFLSPGFSLDCIDLY